MKKIRLIFLILISISITAPQTGFAQKAEKYSRVKVYANKSDFKTLLLKGIALDELAERTPEYITGDFSAKEIALIKQTGLKIEIITDDLAADFLVKNKADQLQNQNQLRTGGTPPGFSYGSMGGYLTFDQMVAELDEMKTLYPNLITTKSSIGTTSQGRSIWMVKISDNPTVDESQEPGVLYTGLTHSREPISMMSLIYYMQYILSQYATDPEVACLLNNRELYFVPCVNPDGYVYNQTTNPNGGGFWRKNRFNNGDGTFGVDLNRNAEYFWGYDNVGSSPTPTSEIYRGASAASELETVALRNFVNTTQLSTAFSNHSYGNDLLLPFGYNNSPTFNETHYRSVASMLTYENKYLYGRDSEILGYSANGRMDDWMYGSKNIWAFTPETGHPMDDFWPVQSKIIPFSEQNLDMNISAAWSAGNYIKPRIANDLFVSGSSYNLPISVTNYGNAAGTIETVQLSISDSRIQSYDNSVISLSGLAVDNTLTVSKNIVFTSSATNGTISGNLITTNSEGCTYNLPISFQYSPNGCFAIPPSWAAIDIGSPGLAGSSCYQNGTYTIKGSGLGVTGTSDKCHMMRLVTATNVTDIIAQVLTDQNTSNGARAGITISETTSPGSKRISLFVNPSNNKLELHGRSSTNGNVNIIGINGAGTVPKWLRIVKSTGGNYIGYYSSNGTSWTQIGKQKVSLVTNVTAGLIVTSGSSTVLHTATFNNLAVTTPGGVINKTIAATVDELESKDFKIFPNPSTGIIDISLPFTDQKQSIRLFDINGKMLMQEAGVKNRRQLNLTHLPNGIYYLQLTEGVKASYRKFIISK